MEWHASCTRTRGSDQEEALYTGIFCEHLQPRVFAFDVTPLLTVSMPPPPPC
jgi:hypothetical protein